MKTIKTIFALITAAGALTFSGCATHDEYQDEQEYSNMPWNTPQDWEGSRSIPGISGSSGY
ncbi:hypothetical protein EGM51_15040 [Verrucomicrobia bacterium S94]|nr:hypothetical protein EGM51_15040 [Verrucomicrobia bacterium S94]